MKKTLIMMCGVSGSGKTTISRHLATYFDHAPYISLDNVRTVFFGTRKCQDCGKQVYEAGIVRIASAFMEHDVVFYDATNLTKDYRKNTVEDVHKLVSNTDVYCVYVKANAETSLKQNASRNEEERVPQEVILRQLKKLEPPSAAEKYLKEIFEITTQTLDKAKEIAYTILTKQMEEE